MSYVDTMSARICGLLKPGVKLDAREIAAVLGCTAHDASRALCKLAARSLVTAHPKARRDSRDTNFAYTAGTRTLAEVESEAHAARASARRIQADKRKAKRSEIAADCLGRARPTVTHRGSGPETSDEYAARGGYIEVLQPYQYQPPSLNPVGSFWRGARAQG